MSRTPEQLERHRIYQNGYRERNRAMLVAKQKAAYQTPKVKAQVRARYLRNPLHGLISEARKRARERGVEFSITKQDLVIPDVCPVLGIPIIHGGWAVSPRDNWPSLDRFNNALGYVPSNVRVISYRANRLKQDASLDEVERLLRYMRGH